LAELLEGSGGNSTLVVGILNDLLVVATLKCLTDDSRTGLESGGWSGALNGGVLH